RPFRLAVTGRGAPRHGQIVKAIPLDAGGAATKKLCRPVEAPDLHFFRPETRHPDFTYPERQIGNGADFLQLLWPFTDLPQVPVERKAMHRDRVEPLQNTEILHALHEAWINRRYSAQDPDDIRIFPLDGIGSQDCHFCEAAPVRIYLRVPM